MTGDPHDLAPPTAGRLGPVTTERLALRAFVAGDADVVAPIFAQDDVWRYPYGRGLTAEESASFVAGQVDHWDDYGFGLWLASERAGGRVVGYVGLSVPTFLPEVLPAVEVGWRLDPGVWGRGYATEGARAALHQAFTTLALEEVCSVTERANEASNRVERRLGLQLERTVVVPGNARRAELDALLWRITAERWRGG